MATVGVTPKFCSHCGAALAPHANNCSQCGAPVYGSAGVAAAAPAWTEPAHSSGLDDLATDISGSGLIDSADAYVKYKIASGVVGLVFFVVFAIFFLSQMSRMSQQPAPVIHFGFGLVRLLAFSRAQP